MATLIESFWTHFDKPSYGCWLWNRALDEKGYGVVRTQGGTKLVHRLAWELYNHRKVPKDREVTHTCQNKHCGAPKHLRLVEAPKLGATEPRYRRLGEQEARYIQATLKNHAGRRGGRVAEVLAYVFGVHKSTIRRLAGRDVRLGPTPSMRRLIFGIETDEAESLLKRLEIKEKKR